MGGVENRPKREGEKRHWPGWWEGWVVLGRWRRRWRRWRCWPPPAPWSSPPRSRCSEASALCTLLQIMLISSWKLFNEIKKLKKKDHLGSFWLWAFSRWLDWILCERIRLCQWIGLHLRLCKLIWSYPQPFLWQWRGAPYQLYMAGADQYKRFAFNTFKICLLSFLGHSGVPPWYSGRHLAAINQPNFEC